MHNIYGTDTVIYKSHSSPEILECAWGPNTVFLSQNCRRSPPASDRLWLFVPATGPGAPGVCPPSRLRMIYLFGQSLGRPNRVLIHIIRSRWSSKFAIPWSCVHAGVSRSLSVLHPALTITSCDWSQIISRFIKLALLPRNEKLTILLRSGLTRPLRKITFSSPQSVIDLFF